MNEPTSMTGKPASMRGVEHTELLGGGNQCLFILQAVAQADLTKGNRRGNIHALDLLKKNKMGKAYI